MDSYYPDINMYTKPKQSTASTVGWGIAIIVLMMMAGVGIYYLVDYLKKDYSTDNCDHGPTYYCTSDQYYKVCNKDSAAGDRCKDPQCAKNTQWCPPPSTY